MSVSTTTRLRLVGAAVALALITAACSSGSVADDSEAVSVTTAQEPSGAEAPITPFATFDGATATLAEFRGEPVVLNFWASWCKPCEQEAADLQTAWEEYDPSGQVVFLGVDYVDTEPEAKEYLAKFDITYPNGPDLGTRISQTFRIQGVPETYFIDQDGNLTFVKKGPFTSLSEIRAVIDPLLEPR